MEGSGWVSRESRIRPVECALRMRERQNLQPRLPILREVYHGVREVMFDDYEPLPKIPP